MAFGAAEERFTKFVRLAGVEDLRDVHWRPIDVNSDFIDTSYEDLSPKGWPEDMTALYYWREDYWLKDRGAQAVRH
jgi:hypothetical protein